MVIRQRIHPKVTECRVSTLANWKMELYLTAICLEQVCGFEQLNPILGLPLRAGGWEFSPAIMNVIPACFCRKIEEN